MTGKKLERIGTQRNIHKKYMFGQSLSRFLAQLLKPLEIFVKRAIKVSLLC